MLPGCSIIRKLKPGRGRQTRLLMGHGEASFCPVRTEHKVSSCSTCSSCSTYWGLIREREDPTLPNDDYVFFKKTFKNHKCFLKSSSFSRLAAHSPFPDFSSCGTMVLIRVNELLLLLLRPANLPGDASDQWRSQERPALPGRNTNSSASPSWLKQLPLPPRLPSPHRAGSHRSAKQRQLQAPFAALARQVRAMRMRGWDQLGRDATALISTVHCSGGTHHPQPPPPIQTPPLALWAASPLPV